MKHLIPSTVERLLAVSLLLLLLMLPAISAQTRGTRRKGKHARPHTSRTKPAQTTSTTNDLAALMRDLRGRGAKVERGESVEQPFFSVKGQVLKVNGQDVQIFEYADASRAEAEARSVAPNGSSVGTNMMTWVATPHFFRQNRIIALYIGDDQGVLRTLEAALGRQFAGG